MKKSLLAAVVACVVVFAGVAYFESEPAQKLPQDAAPVNARATPPGRANPATVAPATTGLVSSHQPPTRDLPADPRLAALMAPTGNARIEYLSDSEGRLVREIDDDPGSAGYRNPLREFVYVGKQLIRVVRYHYFGDKVQVDTSDVIYQQDGSVAQVRDTTRYESKTRRAG